MNEKRILGRGGKDLKRKRGRGEEKKRKVRRGIEEEED